MDPTANLKEQIELAQNWVEWVDDSEPPEEIAAINRLSELVLALDEWIKKGGFLPRQWTEAFELLNPPD